MMTDSTFLPSDSEAQLHEIVQELYDRLNEVRRMSAVKFAPNDEFELGINCCLANETQWLENLLDKIERS